MIICRTPLRMSFVGGGSDLPEYYRRENCGAVVSTAINKYVYVSINRKFDNGVRVAYSIVEEVKNAEAIVHPIVRAAMGSCGLTGGVEITTIADIPSRGTGLGSSSAFTVGLLNGLAAYQSRFMSPSTLGREACHVEIDLCSEPIGKQDQYASAYGGFNLYEFRADERVDVTPIIMPPGTRQTLEDRTIVFYTGLTRSATSILKEQSAGTATNHKNRSTLRRMVQLSYDLVHELRNGNLDTFGDILHENWELKKTLAANVSNPTIDDWYDRARNAGAIGGKLLGAGAGGFLMFYAHESMHHRIEAALGELRPMPVRFDPLGSRIIFYDPQT